MSSNQLPPTPVRMPPDLKERLQAEAKANVRSLNGEIVARLRSTLEEQRAYNIPRGSDQQ